MVLGRAIKKDFFRRESFGSRRKEFKLADYFDRTALLFPPRDQGA